MPTQHTAKSASKKQNDDRSQVQGRPQDAGEEPRQRGRPKTDLGTEKVMVVPDVSLMQKIGRTGYSLPEILAEFIDNSLDARVNDTVHVDVSIDASRVTITDDASGMSKSHLVSALTLAASAKVDSLGEYGIGLKAAAVAMADAFVIETKQAGQPHGYRVAWDAAEWKAAAQWSYQVQTRLAKKDDLGNSGTTIELTQLRFAPMKRVGFVKNELGRRFGPFIRAKQLVLRVNGSKCSAPSPELLAQSGLTVQNPQEFSLTTQGGKTITGWVGLLANSSQKGLYGFDTFRRGRMITYNDKLGFTAHPTVARVCGEVHMDHVPVTSNKREWVKTDALYEDAEHTVAEFIQPWLAASRQFSVANHTMKPAQQNKLDAFKAGIEQAFQSEDLKGFTTPRGGERGVGQPSDVPIETRSERSDLGGTHESGTPADAPETERTRNPRTTDPNTTRRMKIGGKAFNYTHEFSALGADAPWCQYDWNLKTRELLVLSNTEHPLMLMHHADHAMLAFMHICESIATICTHEVQGGLVEFFQVQSALLRDASRHVAQL